MRFSSLSQAPARQGGNTWNPLAALLNRMGWINNPAGKLNFKIFCSESKIFQHESTTCFSKYILVSTFCCDLFVSFSRLIMNVFIFYNLRSAEWVEKPFPSYVLLLLCLCWFLRTVWIVSYYLMQLQKNHLKELRNHHHKLTEGVF